MVEGVIVVHAKRSSESAPEVGGGRGSLDLALSKMSNCRKV